MRSPWSTLALLVGAFVLAFGGYFAADAISGTQAVVGERGAQGPAGADGADGRDGADGVDGVDGADGATGPRGIPGATGAAGPAGADGATGAEGPPGPPGPTGAPGADGPTGATGADGPTGPVGPTGPPGPTGQPGADGPTSFATIVTSPPAVNAGAGTVTLAEVAVPEGTWIVSAGWQGMSATNTNYVCYMSNSENSQTFDVLNSKDPIVSYSMTQVFTVPSPGTTLSLRCVVIGANSVAFGMVTLSAIEVTG